MTEQLHLQVHVHADFEIVMGGGAWLFLVGGAICLVNSDNERDSGMLTSYTTPEWSVSPNFLEGQVAFSHPRLSNNRSVMPLDVRGCTRATRALH